MSGMSRRSFIDHAGALGAGAALAAVAPGRPGVRAAQAQTAPPVTAGGILSPNRFDYSPINVHPWVTGWPWRSRYLDRALAHITQYKDIWKASGTEVIDWYKANANV